MSPNVLIYAGRGGNPRLVGLLCEAHPELDFTAVASLDEAEERIAEADIFMSFGLPRDIFATANRLKWVHSLGTGVNGLVDAPSLGHGVIVTATRGNHGAPMSEAAFLMLLSLARDFPRALRQQAEQRWARYAPQLLRGKRVGVVGTGVIAREFAPRCKAFGMHVTGFSRTARPIGSFDEVTVRERLPELAPTLDFLVLLVPLDEASRHLVDARVLSAMKPTAFLVNLARGAVVDESALVDALRAGRIAGAGLDTFVEEPLPGTHPLWTTPNTLITPHLGGFCDETEKDIVRQFSANLARFLAGDFGRMANREAIR